MSHALPLLTNALASVSSEETWITSSALEVTTSIMKGAQEGQLGQGFFAGLGPALFKSINETEDRDIIQVFLALDIINFLPTADPIVLRTELSVLL